MLFYQMKIEDALLHPTNVGVVEGVIIFIALSAVIYFLNCRWFLSWRAERGSRRALVRLTRRLMYRGLHRDIKAEAKQLIRHARLGRGWAMYTLSTRIGIAGDRSFGHDRNVAFMWMRKAALANDPQAQDVMFSVNAGSGTVVHDDEDDKDAHIDPEIELGELIGLDNVKRTVADIASRTQLFERRRMQGLRVSQPALHLIFLGNPGTGKTTVARILGRLLKKAGYLSRGHVVEVSEGEMIGEYVGQTPIKVQRKIQQALGGVLFIDEAYAMLNAASEQASFSNSAIATLVKFMEDLRHDLVVIAAGYPKEMVEFMESNPGLKSRFTEVISFPDYDGPDLTRIFMKLAEENQYLCSREAQARLLDIMLEAKENFTHNFSNGRFVRNMFEDTIKYMAIRLGKKIDITKNDLVMIFPEDIEMAYQDAQRAYGHKTEEARSIGFLTGNR